MRSGCNFAHHDLRRFRWRLAVLPVETYEDSFVEHKIIEVPSHPLFIPLRFAIERPYLQRRHAEAKLIYTDEWEHFSHSKRSPEEARRISSNVR